MPSEDIRKEEALSVAMKFIKTVALSNSKYKSDALVKVRELKELLGPKVFSKLLNS